MTYSPDPLETTARPPREPGSPSSALPPPVLRAPHASPGPVARPLRAWQRRALAAYAEAHRAGARDFLVTATPGAGKTAFALTLAAELLRARAIDRVIVVCPTDHLRTQWARAAHEAGIELDPTLSNAVGPVRKDLRGYVTTYAQVAAKPLLHRGRAEARRSLVILDEIHHAGDGLSWGEAVAEAFTPARRRLALTGTPFRTRADELIPFVRYDDDGEGGLRSVADFTYGYREGLADGVVRPVVFAAYTGVARWRNCAQEVVSASLSEPLTKSAEATAWRTALDPRGQWVPHVIAAMDDRISHLRASGMSDAAGLVLASDQEAARAYAKIVRRVTGERPALILSDDPRASGKIEKFAGSDQRIAVCVRMISEGVDIPRAACLAWLTSYRTPLFFAQAVGRVVRSRQRGESATVFLPAVRPLLTLAAELESERNHVIPPPEPSDELLDPPPLPEREAGRPAEWEALGASAAFAHVLHAGRAVVPEPVAAPAALGADQPPDTGPLDDDAADFLGLPGLLSPEQTATLLAKRDAELRRRAARASEPDDASPGDLPAVGEVTSWEDAARLRREINRLVGRVAALEGVPHAVVHARLRAVVPGPPSASASVQVLRRRLEAVRGM